MKSNMVKFLSLALAVIMVFGLAPCGRSVALAAEPTAKIYKEKVVIANSTVYSNSDPYANNTLVNFQINCMTHQNLVSYDESTGNVVPDLALEWKYVDDTTLEMKLDPAAKWTDGSAVTADDVVFSMERCAGSSSQAAKVTCVDTVEATDSNTVVFHLAYASSEFLVNLCEPCMTILSRAAMEADEEKGLFVGSGPYSVTEWVPDDHVTLTRKDDYWGEMPNTKIFEYRKVAEDAARTIGLQAGDIDIVLNLPAIDAPTVDADPNCALVSLTGTQLYQMNLNMLSPNMQDLKVRQAIQYAINPADYIIVIAEGFGSQADGLGVASCFGYNDHVNGYEYNPEKAKELLAEAGYTGGLTLKTVINGSQFQSMLDLITAQLAEVGITVEVISTDNAVYAEKYKGGEHDFTISRWAFGANLDGLWRSQWFVGTSNVNNIDLPEFESMVNEAETIMDDDARRIAFEEIQQYQMDVAWTVPLYVNGLLIGTNPNLEGMTFRNDQRHDFTYACVVEG